MTIFSSDSILFCFIYIAPNLNHLVFDLQILSITIMQAGSAYVFNLLYSLPAFCNWEQILNMKKNLCSI